jgi:ADP-heptose:LPS heptosyltransferase
MYDQQSLHLNNMAPMKIIISRTDHIGDVVLTLPVAGILKKKFPYSEIIFLGRSYTEPVVRACSYIDRFIDWTELESMNEPQRILAFSSLEADVIIHVFPNKSIAVTSRKAKIPIRIGTSHRWYHWVTCNRMVHFSRKRSIFHETQLNLRLLKPLGIDEYVSADEISRMPVMSIVPSLKEDLGKLLSKKTFNLILHPLSGRSAREWGLENYKKLIGILPGDLFTIFITGTEEEGMMIREQHLAESPHVIDLTGRLTLDELIHFIGCADGLIAGSTGPLHIAAALGKYVIGIYSPLRPIHPGRWAPVGLNASYLVKSGLCSKCRHMKRCDCIETITPEDVKTKLMEIIKS